MLGTVQFGIPYGIANQMGQVSPGAAAAILDCARAAGVDMLDTAINYGDSERRLGDIGIAGWQVVTKLPPLAASGAEVAGWVRDAVRGSCHRLKLPRLYALLLHRPVDLLGSDGEALYRVLRSVQDEGLVERIGVSVYDPEEIEQVVPRFHLDVVQAPFNPIDRRLESSGWLSRLQQAGIEVHVRSVFLQGVLLMDAANRPRRFAPWQSIFERWQQWLSDAKLTPVQACMAFAMAAPGVGRIVVGVDSVRHLEEILAAVDTPAPAYPVQLTSTDPRLINPSYWSSL